MARPTKPLISRDAVVAAAIDIIDREGLEAFSLPRVATYMGVRAPSLYHHFTDKHEILSEVARAVVGSVVRPRHAPGPDWPEFFVSYALNFRQALLRHRNTAPILVQHLQRELLSENYEDTATFLRDCGVPVDLHVRILDGVETLCLGGVLTEAMHEPTTKRTIFPDVVSATQPALAAALRANELTQRKLFEERVRSFLHGIISDHEL